MPPARIAAAAGMAVASLALASGFAAQPAPRPAPAPTIEGTVRDPAGKPIDKAVVLARPLAGDRPLRTATTRSDASGRFSLAVPRAGEYMLRIEAAALAPHTIERLGVPAAPLAITLRKGGTIDGIVRDARGKPVAGARVDARTGVRLGTLLMEPDAGRVRATSDAKGVFRLEGLATAGHTVIASAPGLGGVRRDGVTPGTKLDLYLTPGAAVRGIVRGPDRRPLAGATVVIEPELFSSAPTSIERSDAAGAFQAWGLKPGAWRVIAFHADFAPAVASVVLEKNVEQSVDLSLGPPARLRGRLVDSDGRPLRGSLALQELDAQVVVQSLGEMFRADADAQGRFTLERLPRAPLALGVTVRGYAPKRVEAAPETAELDLGDVVLDRGLTIRGRVHDASGRGIADAQVRGATQGMAPSRVFLEATTDVDGTFVLAGAEPGLYRVTAEAFGFAPAATRASAGAEPVDIVLQRAGSITGSVVDEKGALVAAFQVTATPTEQGENWRPEFGDGSEGRFDLPDVAAGAWVVQVKAADKAEARVPGVKVRTGVVTDIGRVRLVPGAAVRGRVTDSAGSPVAGANVWAETPERVAVVFRSGRQGTFTDTAGAFELLGVDPGRVDVVADHPEFAPARLSGVEVDPVRGGTDARITLTRGGRVEGTARRRDGRPIERAQVRVVGTVRGSAMAFGVLAPDGTFGVEHVQPGSARVMLSVSSGDNVFSTAQEQPVNVSEGETAMVDFLLRDIFVSGTVTRRGEPAPGLKVTMRGGAGGGMYYTAPTGLVPAAPSGPQRGWAITRQDGSYELLVEEPATYMVNVTSADGRSTYPVRTLEVPDADATTADFAFGGALVAGQVVDAESAAPVAGSVFAAPSSGDHRRAATAVAGADGRFQLEVDPGEFEIGARAEGYATARTKVTVNENGASDVRIALKRGASISGRTLDSAGRPVPALMVTANPAGELPPGTVSMSRMGFTRGAADGTFTITSLSEGRYSLSAGDELGGFGVAPDVAAGSTGVVLRLAPGGRLRAAVLHPDGSPASSLFVAVTKVDGRRSMGGRSGRTDAAGVAEFAVPAGTLEVRAGDQREEGTATVTVSAGETASAEIRLQPRSQGPGTR